MNARRYPCARCGRRVTADKAVFSRHTRKHYCSGVDECARRAARMVAKAALGMGVKVW